MSTDTITFRKGDQVELVRDDFGPLKRGSKGIVVEVSERYSYYPVTVVWPGLRHTDAPTEGPFLPEGIDLDSLHEGDVVPMRAEELRATGKNYLEGGEQG